MGRITLLVILGTLIFIVNCATQPSVTQPQSWKEKSSDVSVLFHNQVSLVYAHKSVYIELDGKKIFEQIIDKTQHKNTNPFQESVEVFNGSLTTGEHILELRLVYSTNPMGIYQSMYWYKFTIESSYDFTVRGDKPTTVTIVAYDKFDWELAKTLGIKYILGPDDSLSDSD